MATLAHEGDPPSDSSAIPWEAVPVPLDYRVIEGEGDKDGLRVIEAFWDGEAKVTADVELVFGEEYSIGAIGRPDFWGADSRPLAAQRREYEIGLDGIVGTLIAEGAEGVEIIGQSGVIAAAAANLRPAGWKMNWRPEDSWLAAGATNLQEVIERGAKVSIRFEKTPVPEGNVGRVAAAAAMNEPPGLSVVR